MASVEGSLSQTHLMTSKPKSGLNLLDRLRADEFKSAPAALLREQIKHHRIGVDYQNGVRDHSSAYLPRGLTGGGGLR